MRLIVAATTPLLLLLSACEQDEPSNRPGDQPLERLLTKEARQQASEGPQLSELGSSDIAQACKELITAVREGGLIVESTDPAELVVDQALWGRLPIESRAVIIKCVHGERGTSPETRLTIVDANGATLPSK